MCPSNRVRQYSLRLQRTHDIIEMARANDSEVCRDLYLELLKKSLTGTLFAPEPDADTSNPSAFAFGMFKHYIKGGAISMLPLCRFDNLRSCITELIERGVAGDLIETGVWRGGATIFMRALLKTYGVTDRIVWAADSFEGLPEPDPERFPKEAAFHRGQITQKLYNNLAVSLEDVQANFAAYGVLDEQVRFLKGWFRDTLPSAPIDRLCLLRLDGDYYESTMDALTNLYGKLSIGGIVIIDDYAEDGWTNCRQAVDEFRAQHAISEPMNAVDTRCYWWRKAG